MSFTRKEVARAMRESFSGYSQGIGAWGDSLTADGYYRFADTDVHEYARGWTTWIGPMSMQRMRVVGCWARGGQGVLAGNLPLGAQIDLARASGLLAKISRGVILAGTNDANYAIEACANELMRQIDRLPIPVSLLSPPPRTASQTIVGSGMPIWVWLLRWRDRLRRISDDSGGWIDFVDAYSLGNTPNASPDFIRADSTYDNLHFNAPYAYRVADAFVSSQMPAGVPLKVGADVWPNNTSIGSTGAAQCDQAVANPLMVASTGGLADGYTRTAVGSATVANAIVASSSGMGNAQQLTVTSTAAGDGVNFQSASFSSGDFPRRGDIGYAQAYVEVDMSGGNIAPRNMRFQLYGYRNPTNYKAALFELDGVYGSENGALPIASTRSFLFRTPGFVVPDGAAFDNLQVSLRPVFNGAGTGIVRASNFEARFIRP